MAAAWLPLLALLSLGSSGCVQMSAPPLRGCRISPALRSRPASMAADPTSLEIETKIWHRRQQMIRSSFEAVVNWKEDDLERKRQGGDSTDASSTRSTVVLSASVVVIAAFILRLGGRAALVSALGLDIIADLGIGSQIDQVVGYANDLGVWAVAAFFAAWIVAKVFLIDFISIALAVASGVVFGGVFEGGALSAVGATLGSLVAFQLSRTLLRERAAEAMEKQPIARALGKVVEEDGFRTVFVLRLSPIVPIPLGAYSYIYGASALDTGSFISGTFLGSFKPYLVDSYLGVFSKQIIDGASLDSTKDLILLIGVGALVFVGVFATELAAQTFDRVQAEMDEDAKACAALSPTEEAALESEWEVGPFSKAKELAANATQALVPEGVRAEVEGVWNGVRSFCDEQWDDAVAEVVAKRQEKQYLEQVSQPSISSMSTPAGDRERAEAARRRMAEWSFEGPQPWRQALTSLVFSFAVFDACQARWSNYSRDELYSTQEKP